MVSPLGLASPESHFSQFLIPLAQGQSPLSQRLPHHDGLAFEGSVAPTNAK